MAIHIGAAAAPEVVPLGRRPDPEPGRGKPHIPALGEKGQPVTRRLAYQHDLLGARLLQIGRAGHPRRKGARTDQNGEATVRTHAPGPGRQEGAGQRQVAPVVEAQVEDDVPAAELRPPLLCRVEQVGDGFPGAVEVAAKLDDDRAVRGRVAPADSRERVLVGPGRVRTLGQGTRRLRQDSQFALDGAAMRCDKTVERPVPAMGDAQGLQQSGPGIHAGRLDVAPGGQSADEAPHRSAHHGDGAPIDGGQPGAQEVRIGRAGGKDVVLAPQHDEADRHRRGRYGLELAVGVAVVSQGGDTAEIDDEAGSVRVACLALQRPDPPFGLGSGRGAEGSVHRQEVLAECGQVLQLLSARIRGLGGGAHGDGREERRSGHEEGAAEAGYDHATSLDRGHRLARSMPKSREMDAMKP